MKAMLIVLMSGCLMAASRPIVVHEEEAQWKARLEQIARDYVKYGRVDGKYRWAPTDCDRPSGPPRMHFSQARDKDTHGQKLYTIFAKEVQWDQSRVPTYLPARLPDDPRKPAKTMDEIKRQTAAVGQVIVKEAWVPVSITREAFLKEVQKYEGMAMPSVDAAEANKTHVLDFGDRVRPLAVARSGAQWFKAEKKAGLFIMMKLDPATPGTDQGWVYGTVDDDLKTVSSVGKVANCMKCHQDAPHDRLFGYPNRGDGL